MIKKKNKKELISVLMPAYDAGNFIGEAIESILAQSYNNFELIIIDDASKDNTWEIMCKYVKKDKRIKAHRNKKRLGISLNRNKLLTLSKGSYVAWQDADDVSINTRLEKQLNELKNNPKLGIIGGYLELFNEDGSRICIRKYPKENKELVKKIFFYSPVSQGASMLRKEVFKKTGVYDKKLNQAEDLDMSFRVAKYYQLSNLQEVVLKCRYHVKSTSTKQMKQNIKNTLWVRNNAVNKYGYSMNPIDKLVYFLTWITQFLSPRITFYLFNIFRNI